MVVRRVSRTEKARTTRNSANGKEGGERGGDSDFWRKFGGCGMKNGGQSRKKTGKSLRSETREKP